MKYASSNAFRTALESRLLARATEGNIPLIRLRKLVAFDRLRKLLEDVAAGVLAIYRLNNRPHQRDLPEPSSQAWK
jgi:hypothetical protein